MYLFFDTETTGLPKNYKAPVSDVDNWPRLVQIAWLLYDLDGKKIESGDHIIRPEGFTIPLAASRVHGISTERAVEEGHELTGVLGLFNDLIKEANFVVAHNISFDEKIIGAEFFRKNIQSELFQKKRLCTMNASTNFCKIPGPYGYKWPKLSELHIALFGKGFDEAHDAAVDIHATAKCFWKMKELGIV
jgi:DNA polymerase III subunit epsilon